MLDCVIPLFAGGGGGVLLGLALGSGGMGEGGGGVSGWVWGWGWGPFQDTVLKGGKGGAQNFCNSKRLQLRLFQTSK